MKKTVTAIPWGNRGLDFFKAMKARFEGKEDVSWFLINEETVEEFFMMSEAPDGRLGSCNSIFQIEVENVCGTNWYLIRSINSEDFRISSITYEPKEIFFIRARDNS